MSGQYDNQILLTGPEACASLEKLVALCRDFAEPLPEDEDAQASDLETLIACLGAEIRAGRLGLAGAGALSEPVIRLYKGPVGAGKLKVQLFPLDRGQSHPPHAHIDLISCQLVLEGRALITEHSVIERPDAHHLVIGPKAVKLLRPGDGVFTLARRNNVHWQEGLVDGTVLINVNWQGLAAARRGKGKGRSGRQALAWSRRRPAGAVGATIVPLHVAEPEKA